MPRLTPDEIAEQLARYPQPDPAMVRAYLTRVPPSWRLIDATEPSCWTAFRRGHINVLASLEVHDDHETWIHVSVTGLRDQPGSWFLPSWSDMKRVKHDFIGADAWAYSVLPSEARYVNDNKFCLHLYARYDGRPVLPDFTRGTGGL